MIQEHEWLRPAKRAIVDLAGNEGNISPEILVNELCAKIAYLTSLLKSHISREDQILYPMAFQVITNPHEWDYLKQACDEIGYCPFTPGE